MSSSLFFFSNKIEKIKFKVDTTRLHAFQSLALVTFMQGAMSILNLLANCRMCASEGQRCGKAEDDMV